MPSLNNMENTSDEQCECLNWCSSDVLSTVIHGHHERCAKRNNIIIDVDGAIEMVKMRGGSDADVIEYLSRHIRSLQKLIIEGHGKYI